MSLIVKAFKNIFSWSGKINKKDYFIYGFLPIILLLAVLFYFSSDEYTDIFYSVFIILAILFPFVYFPSSLKRWRDIGADKITIFLFLVSPLIALLLELFEMIDINNLVRVLLIIPINLFLLLFLPSNSLNGYKGIILFILSFIISYFTISYLLEA